MNAYHCKRRRLSAEKKLTIRGAICIYLHIIYLSTLSSIQMSKLNLHKKERSNITEAGADALTVRKPRSTHE